MYNYPTNFSTHINIDNINSLILDFNKGDVNGDGVMDYVYLIGNEPLEDSPFRDNIRLMIIDGKTKNEKITNLKVDKGYSPTLFLGDFSGNTINDILISINTGGSGGFTFHYIYSYINNQPELLFDFEKFNKAYKYKVNYKKDYKVEIICKTTKTKYILDINYKGKPYLLEIYDENGKLKKAIKGRVNPLGALYPIDFQRDGTYELLAEQRIAGRYNTDGLGYVQTSLKWDGKDFVPFFTTISIYGEKL